MSCRAPPTKRAKRRKAAREAASILDDYAKYLVQPAFGSKTATLHATATNKLRTASDALASSDKWMKGHDDAVAKKGGQK